MKHRRNRPGLIITLASDTPDGRSRTIYLPHPLLLWGRRGAMLGLLLLGLAGLWLLLGALQLEQRLNQLQLALEQKDAQLAASHERLEEMTFATGQLLDEIGTLGAMVRELQSFAGLEPSTLPHPAMAVAAGNASGFAFGGPAEPMLPLRSVDLPLAAVDDVLSTARDDIEMYAAGLDRARDEIALQQAIAAATPARWPVRGWLSSAFGMRRNPIDGEVRMHRGIDIAATYRTPVAATAAGVVEVAGWSRSGYGYHVVIDHGFGFKTLYAHLSEVAVEVGDRLAAGDTVGLVGSTGNSTGPHLHYEVWRHGVPQDPAGYLAAE